MRVCVLVTDIFVHKRYLLLHKYHMLLSVVILMHSFRTFSLFSLALQTTRTDKWLVVLKTRLNNGHHCLN